jgi:hypothetical protein
LQPLNDQEVPSETPPAPKKAKLDNFCEPKATEEQDNVKEPSEWQVYVKIKDVETENISKRKFFLVRFFLKAKSVLASDDKKNKFVVNAEEKCRMINLLNVGIKGAMLDAGLRTFDKYSNKFFPTDMKLQSDLMKNLSKPMPYIAPITGLSEQARISVDDNLFVMVNFCMKWANINIPVLCESTSDPNILGVSIDLNDLPLSAKQLEDVYQQLKNISFHIKYDKGQKWCTAMKDKGKSDDFIQRCREFTKRGTCRLFKSKNEQRNEEILPTAEDHKFKATKKDENGNQTNFSVKTWYETKGVRLKYPNLPLVRISKDEWFPIEFLWQGMSTCAVLV